MKIVVTEATEIENQANRMFIQARNKSYTVSKTNFHRPRRNAKQDLTHRVCHYTYAVERALRPYREDKPVKPESSLTRPFLFAFQKLCSQVHMRHTFFGDIRAQTRKYVDSLLLGFTTRRNKGVQRTSQFLTSSGREILTCQ